MLMIVPYNNYNPITYQLMDLQNVIKSIGKLVYLILNLLYFEIWYFFNLFNISY